MIAHLPRCLALDPTGRYVCNCGADAQNSLAAKLDALPPIAPTPPVDTPLHAAARLLRRLAASACHHDAARHLLASAAEQADLAATLSPEEAIRVLDEVEVEPAPIPSGCAFCSTPHDPGDCCQA
jgi:hypothetical protein